MSQSLRARRRSHFFGNLLGHAVDLSPSSSAVLSKHHPSGRSRQRSRRARLEQLEPRLALAGELDELLPSGKAPGTRPVGWFPADTAEINETPSAPDPVVQRSIVPGEVIVSFVGEVEIAQLEEQLANNLALARLDLGGSVKLTHLLTTLPTSDHGAETLVSLRLGEFADVRAVGGVIDEQVVGVAWTQPNFAYTGKIKEFTPNDPLYTLQSFHLVTQTNLAWDFVAPVGAQSIVVAVTDDGIDLDHPDLVPNLWANPDEIPGNGVDDDSNGKIDDVIGWDFVSNDNNVTPSDATDEHGTHVAGIIGARTNNSLGVAGTAGGTPNMPAAKLMPLRIAGTVAGSPVGFTSTIMLNSFTYAAGEGAKIVNTSYNIDFFVGDAVFTSGLQFLYDNNIIHVNSAGNDDVINPIRQAFHQTLLVAHTTNSDVRGGFSNSGTGIDISAPGDLIVSTIPGTAASGDYDQFAGTSMSTAVVSGTAALIWMANPTLTRDQVVARLLGLATSIDAQNPAYAGLLGGRVNPNTAINGTLVAPRISGLRGIPNTPNPAILPTNRLNVGLSHVLDKTSVETAANWSLVSAGPDTTLGTADDVPIPLSRLNPYMVGANDVTFSCPMLPAGSYRFTAISGGLRNPFNTALDGDANGTAGGNFVKDFQVVPGTIVFNADFSDAGGAPSAEGFGLSGTTNQWHLSTGRGLDPGHSTDDSVYFGAGETLVGGGLYNNLAAGSLTSPLIDLSGYSGQIRVEFNHFLKSEEFFDFASVAVVEGGGVRTLTISGDGTLPHDTTGFQSQFVDLSAYAGRTIRVRFTFSADDSITEEGWYVDDVVVRAQTVVPTANLSGQVFNDLNGNRVREAGENGLANWTVYLDSNNNGALDTPVTNVASTNVPVGILDSTFVYSSTTVSGIPGLITDLDVTVNLTHTWVPDLVLILRSPTGFRIELSSAIGLDDDDNMTNTRFDDEAATSITAGTAPFTGSFRPKGTPLAAFDGTDPNGVWTLEVGDVFYLDVGNLLNWTLHFTSAEPNRVSSATGDYAFNNVPVATHVIREVVQPTWTQSVPIAGAYTVTPAAGQSVTMLDFGNSQAAVTPATFVVTAMIPTPTGYILAFNGNLDPTTLNLYDTEGGGIGPIDLTLVGAAPGALPVRGSAAIDTNLRRLTFVATNGRLPPDTYTLTLRSAADGFRDSTSALLDGDSNGVAGGNYTNTFTVVAPPANAVAVSLPNFARGPQQPVNLPATVTTGIPVSFSDGGGITSASFTLTYNPALLAITGATVAPGLTGATVNINTTTPGTAIVQFLSPTPLAAGTTRFLDLQANVPNNASHRAKHVLNLSAISLNAGLIPAIDDDAIHIAAYFGDATGNGLYAAPDAARISRVGLGLDTGFALYRLLDPVIIGDVSENAAISATDASRVLQVALGISVPAVPPNPGITVTANGPDPKLSIPTSLVGAPGDQLRIPVQIDSIIDLTGNGLEAADLVLFYDPTALDVTSVTLGSLLAGDSNWIFGSRIDPVAGRIIVSLATPRPLEGYFTGDLVELHATIREGAQAGTTAINLAASARNPLQYTSLNEGNLTLIPAPTDSPGDVGVDGSITILAGTTSTSNVATAQLIANQLVITGTSGSDRILVAPVGAGLVRVRAGNQLLGTFATPASILIDTLGGADQVVTTSELPPTLVTTTTDPEQPTDVIFGGSTTRWVEDPDPLTGTNDAALMELLRLWSDELSLRASTSSRLARMTS